MIPESMKQRVENLERELASVRRQFDRDMFRSSMPIEWPKLAVTDAGTGSYPADPANIYPIIFESGTFTESAGAGSATYTKRSAEPRRFAFALTEDYIPEDTVVVCFEQNGRLWIMPSSTTPSGGGGGARAFLSLDWGTGTPSSLYVAPAAAAAKVFWHNNRGATANMVFNAGNESVTLDAGDYLFHISCLFSENDHNGAGEKYLSGHPHEGLGRQGSAFVSVQVDNVGFAQISLVPSTTPAWMMGGYPRASYSLDFTNHLSTAVCRVVVEDATAEFALFLHSASTDSADYGAGLQHATWHIVPMSF